MTKRELIKELKEIAKNVLDTEQAHLDADYMLLKYINSKAVRLAYDEIHKWYA